MAKKATAACKQGATRNWIAYLCESLVTSGVMPTWEAATYLTENLFGEKPNPRLLSTINAYEVTSQFLQRLYHPLVEAVSRDFTLPDGARLHVFTDISLTNLPCSLSMCPAIISLTSCSCWTPPKPGNWSLLIQKRSIAGQKNDIGG